MVGDDSLPTVFMDTYLTKRTRIVGRTCAGAGFVDGTDGAHMRRDNVPLKGSVSDRIRTLHHEQTAGMASRKRSNKQMIAIAFASKRREKRKRK